MQQCVLIYDDDIEILKVCKVILESQNYRVEIVSSCENILNDIDIMKPDIILMDLWIPQTGGEDAIRIMHQNPLTNHIPVILFSANDEIEKISKRINANGFLKKPFDILTLRQTIKNFLT
jgi:DNA-binding NtrC family response regulator